MISKDTLQTILGIVKKEALHGIPTWFMVDYTNSVGQRLAKQLGANQDIVLLGTNLMDYMLTQALAQNKQKEHVTMGVAEAKKLLNNFDGMTEQEKENVLACVSEHHGVKKFHSLESEICCNADCYRFLSVKGFVGGLNSGAERPYDHIVQVYKEKVEEKWNALSLDVCKKELEPQYNAIKEFLLFI